MGPEGNAPPVGTPRLHLRTVGSTSTRARELAAAGAPHGTLVTSFDQTAGRGRQGRGWTVPAGRAIAASFVLRAFDGLLSLRAGLAVADLAGPDARVKWPNDVLLDGRKVAGVLVEGRPQHGWAVLGVGLNVAVDPAALPQDVRGVAGTLGRSPGALEATLAEYATLLAGRLGAPADAVLADLRARDHLLHRDLEWAGGRGTGAGLDAAGRLLVRRPDGSVDALDAGEVHLGTATTT